MASKNSSSYFNGELGQRFGYRKLTVGLCSVVLGSFLLTANHQQVKADTVGENNPVSQNTTDSSNTDTSDKPASVINETSPAKSDSLNNAISSSSNVAPSSSNSQDNNVPTTPVSAQTEQASKKAALQTSSASAQNTQTAQNTNSVPLANAQKEQGTNRQNDATSADNSVATNKLNVAKSAKSALPVSALVASKVANTDTANPADPSADVPKTGYSSSSNTNSTSFEGQLQQRFFIDHNIQTTASVKIGNDMTDHGWFKNSYGVGFELTHDSNNPAEVTVTYQLSDASKNKSYFLDANGNKQYIGSIKHIFNFNDRGNLYIFADQPNSNGTYRAGYNSIFAWNAAVDNGLGELTERAEYYDNDGHRIVIPDTLDIMAFDSLAQSNSERVAGTNGSYVYPTSDGKYYVKDNVKWVTGRDSESTAALAIGAQNHGIKLAWANGGYYFQWGFVPQIPPSSEISEIKTTEYTRTVNILDQHGNKLQDPITQNLVWTWRKKDNDWVSMGDKPNDSETVDPITLPTIAGYHFLGSDDDLNTLKTTLLQAYTTAPTGKNDVINVYYSNETTQDFKFVDTEKDNAQVGDVVTIKGKVGKSANPNLAVPTGYKLASGATLPDNITFSEHAQPITINLVHAHATDGIDINTVRDPDTGKTIHDMTTVEREYKVNVNVPNKDAGDKPKSLDWHLLFTRGYNVDLVTGNVTYGEWKVNGHSVPAVEMESEPITYMADPHFQMPNYTRHTDGNLVLRSKLKNGGVVYILSTDNLLDPPTSGTLNISYIPDTITRTIRLIDDDNNGNVVSSTNVSGLVDQSNVPVTGVVLPADYELAPNNSIPDHLDFTPDKIRPYVPTTGNIDVHVKHIIDRIDPAHPSHGLTAKDFTNTITRQIVIQVPAGHGDPITKTQTVTFKRTGTWDNVAGVPSYTPWVATSTDGTQNGDSFTFNSITVDPIAGYTVNGAIDPLTVNADGTNPDPLTITFTANPQSVKYNFVDTEKGNAVINSTVKNGATDQTITFNKGDFVIPTGYDLVGNLPTSYKFGTTNLDQTIALKHHTEALDPSNPGHGLNTQDFEKTFTRQVTIIDPNGDTDPTSTMQTAVFKRSAKWDYATNVPIYTDWVPQAGSDGHIDGSDFVFNQITVPPFTGYTANGNVTAQHVNINSNPVQSLTIRYNADGQSLAINYVDSNGQLITTQNVSGLTDQTVTISYNVPTNWQMVNSEAPTYTFNGEAEQNKNVVIAHIITDLPEVTQTVTRNVSVKNPDGSTHVLATQSHTFTQHNKLDHVTNKILHGDWSDGDSFTFDKVNIPTIPGYSPASDVPQMTVNHASSSQNLTVEYKANGQNLQIIYVDDKGSQISSQLIAGSTDQTVNIDYKVPEHYHMVSGNIPSYTFKASDNKPITVTLGHNLDARPNDTKTITRVVTITAPDGKTSTQKQIADFTRQTQYDEVLGKDVYGTWSNNGSYVFDAINVPTIDGYAINGSAGTITVTPDTLDKDIAANITYIAGGQSSKYYFVDDDAKGIKVGDDHNIAGKTNQTIKLDIVAPTNYVLVGSVPASYTFVANNNPEVVVHLKHATKDATGDSDADTTRTITRNIHTTKPDGKTTVISQDVTFKRTATRDLVTKQLSYGVWSNDGKAVLSGLASEKIDGYTASSDAPDLAVTPDSQKITDYNITYKANPQKTYWQLVDDDYTSGDPDISQKHNVNGVTDGKVAISVVIPKNYDVVTKDVPTEYTFKAKDNQPIIIHVKHALSNPTSSDGTPDSKLIDDKRVISRTITIVPPHGKSTTETQSVTFTRVATKDLVTGKVTYGAWSNDGKQVLDKLNIPLVAGYTADGVANRITVTPDTKPIASQTIHYLANDGKQTLVFVDDAGNEIGRQTINGKTDQTVPVTSELPDGWSGDVPNEVVIKPNDTPIKVNAKHIVVTITSDASVDSSKIIPGTKAIHFPAGLTKNDLIKTTTRHVVIVLPDGKKQETNQSVSFTRTATVDAVTGKVTYSAFSPNGKDSFDSVAIPDEFGYTPSVKNVPSEKATSDYGAKTINVNYTANPVSVRVIYLDNMTGKEIGTQTLNGLHNQELDFVPDIPDGYQSNNLPAKIKLTQGMPDLTFKLEIKKTDFEINPNQPLKPGEIIPGTNIKAPEGLSYYDLNKDLERIIVFNLPNSMPKTVVQTVTANRTAHIDIKTMKVTYDDWTLPKGAKFKALNVPTVDGYQANVDTIPSFTQIDVNNDTPIQVVVTYSKIKQRGNNFDNSNSGIDNGGFDNSYNGSVNDGIQFDQNSLDQFNNGGSVNSISNLNNGFNTVNIASVKGADATGKGKLIKNGKAFKTALLGGKGKRGHAKRGNSKYDAIKRNAKYDSRYGASYSARGQYGYGANYSNGNNGADYTVNSQTGAYSNMLTGDINNSVGITANALDTSAISKVASQNHGAGDLPQTGEQNSYAILALGLVAIMLSFGLVQPRKKNNQHFVNQQKRP